MVYNRCGWCFESITNKNDKNKCRIIRRTFCSYKHWQKAIDRRSTKSFQRLERFFGRKFRDYEVNTLTIQQLLNQRHYELICPVCERFFEIKTPRQQFCSKKCERIASNRAELSNSANLARERLFIQTLKQEDTCPACNAVFNAQEVHKTHKRFCSKKCRLKAYSRRHSATCRRLENFLGRELTDMELFSQYFEGVQAIIRSHGKKNGILEVFCPRCGVVFAPETPREIICPKCGTHIEFNHSEKFITTWPITLGGSGLKGKLAHIH